jgi:hypothetical protein
MEQHAKVVRTGALDMQVCAPSGWSDVDITEFANRQNPCGTTNGWVIRKEGCYLLAGAPERVACSARAGCVHVTLDA